MKCWKFLENLGEIPHTACKSVGSKGLKNIIGMGSVGVAVGQGPWTGLVMEQEES